MEDGILNHEIILAVQNIIDHVLHQRVEQNQMEHHVLHMIGVALHQ